MKCPSCRDVELDERFRHGTEVDVCPRCKGIWLDRDELDRLLAGAESNDNRDHDDDDDDASSGAITPADLALLSKPEGDNRDDHAGSDERASHRMHDEQQRQDGRDEHDDRKTRSDTGKGRSKKREKSRMERLGDLLEDVLDEVFD